MHWNCEFYALQINGNDSTFTIWYALQFIQPPTFLFSTSISMWCYALLFRSVLIFSQMYSNWLEITVRCCDNFLVRMCSSLEAINITISLADNRIWNDLQTPNTDWLTVLPATVVSHMWINSKYAFRDMIHEDYIINYEHDMTEWVELCCVAGEQYITVYVRVLASHRDSHTFAAQCAGLCAFVHDSREQILLCTHNNDRPYIINMPACTSQTSETIPFVCCSTTSTQYTRMLVCLQLCDCVYYNLYYIRNIKTRNARAVKDFDGRSLGCVVHLAHTTRSPMAAGSN